MKIHSIFLLFSFWFIASQSIYPQSNELVNPVDQIDRLLTELYPTNEPGAVVIVCRNYEILFRKGFGLADVELEVPNSPDFLYAIGSITKQFTASGIMLLVEDGKLNLDDDITKYLPEIIAFGHVVTIRNLLTHTSGIKSYTDDPNWLMKARLPMTHKQVIDCFKDSSLQFMPGEKFRYSDSGYFLLGCIIENVSGQSYFDFLKERIFTPLNMEHTLMGATDPIVKGRSKGYKMVGYSEYQNADYVSLTQPFSAGGFFTTVDDLAKWNFALFGGEVLSAQSLKLLHTSNILPDSTDTHYGFGWEIKNFSGHQIISHRGVITGFTSCAGFLSDDGVFVAVLQNTLMGKYFEEDIMQRIMALTLDIPLPGTRFVDLTRDQGEKYEGKYRMSDESIREVSFNGNGLITQRGEGAKLKLMMAEDGSFFYLHNPQLVVQFERDSTGMIVAMTMFYSDGRTARAEKLPD